MNEDPELKNENQLPYQCNGNTESTIIQCFKCGQIGETQLEYRTGMWTFLICIAMQCVCGPLGLVVLRMNDCKDIYHICRNCKNIVGITEKQIKLQ